MSAAFVAVSCLASRVTEVTECARIPVACRAGLSCCRHLLIDYNSRDLVEHISHIQSRLRRSFKELQAMLFGEGPPSLRLYDLIGTVTFVSDQNFRHIGVSMLLYLL